MPSPAQLSPYANIFGVLWLVLFGSSSIFTVMKSFQAKKFKLPSSHAFTNILLVIANVLLLVIVIAAYLPKKTPPPPPILTPTVIATRVLTPTATPPPTATTTKIPTPAVTVFATPTYSPFLNDPLSHQDANEWDERTYNDGGCQFVGGIYEASGTLEGSRNYCVANASTDSFTDFDYEVQMKVIEGDCGGLLFRIGSLPSLAAYSFEVCQDGTFNVAVYSNDNPTYLINRSPNPAFQTGANQYTLAITAKRNNLTFYVNGQEVGNITNSTYTTGQIGMFAHAHTNYPTEVAFTNAQVWLLG